MVGHVTHPPSLEPTEQPITTSEAEPEEEEEEDDKDDYGDASNSADEDYSKEEKNAGDYGRGLWKTIILPLSGRSLKLISGEKLRFLFKVA